MKRFHLHMRVKDLHTSISFYKTLFSKEPDVIKEDYAKWMLDDPRINFAISTGNSEPGIEHLGIQAENKEELKEVFQNMEAAEGEIFREGDTICCYSKSEKSWIQDPQGIKWEVFHTYGPSTVYGKGDHSRPSPEEIKSWSQQKNMTLPIVDNGHKGNCC